MCGIAGINSPDKKLISNMTKALRHRGPDADGIFVDKKISLGHRRLSILDITSAGKQPMEFEGLYITFNGEIYNFKKIKNELIKLGHKFKSNSDTEVILHAFKEWESKCVSKFNGIWAFAIYDFKNQNLFLSRDRFGVKPLFYFEHAEEFLFASEIKSILEHDLFLATDIMSLNWYFWQKYIPSDASIYTQIKQVPPGHNLNYNLKSKKIKLNPYYNLGESVLLKSKANLTERLESVEEILNTAITDQMISDVPLGGFLSGGVDSALMASIANNQSKNLKTFSMGFHQSSYDESEAAKNSAKIIGTNHNQFKFDVDDQLLEELLNHLDQPFADPAIIPTFLLSSETKKHVSVVLSGDGADEVFGGYKSYTGGLLAQKIPGLFINLLKPFGYLIPDSQKKVDWTLLVKRFLTRYKTNPVQRHLNNMGTQTEFERMELMLQGYVKQFQKSDYEDFDMLTRLQLTDFEYYLPGDILYKTDITSMASGLEVRVPYLDHQLVETVLSLPPFYKNNIFNSKIILREIASKHLGAEIANHKKRGFSVPIYQILKESKLLKEYILSKNYFGHGWLDKVQIKHLWEQNEKGTKENSKILWQVAIFNYWWWKHKKYLYV